MDESYGGIAILLFELIQQTIYVLGNVQYGSLIGFHSMFISGGVFEQPFDVGIQIRGLLEENKSDLVYSGSVHNRSRILRCGKVCTNSWNSLLIWCPVILSDYNCDCFFLNVYFHLIWIVPYKSEKYRRNQWYSI